MANDVLYGVLQEKDLDPLTPAIEVDRDLLIHATQITLGEHNAEINTLTGLFAEDTTEFKLSFEGPTTNDLQPMDEYADPEPVKGAAAFDTSFPIAVFGTAWGVTFITREQMTLQQFSDRTSQMLEGDVNTYRRILLSTLFANVAFTFVDPRAGSLTIKGLANNDTDKYLEVSAVPSVAQHFLAQAAAIDDANNPFPTIEALLTKRPRNAAPFVAFIPPGLTATVSALTDFLAVPTGLIAQPSGTTPSIIGNLTMALPATARVIGVIGSMWIVEWAAMPAGFIIALAGNGPRPLRRRQYPEASLQGFRPVEEMMTSFPYFKTRWFRAFGFGGWNRVGAVVTRIGNAAYAIPVGFEKPLGK